MFFVESLWYSGVRVFDSHFFFFFFGYSLCSFSFLKNYFLLAYSCFTMLCWFILYNKMNQPYVYVYPLPFGLPPHSGHHRALSGVPCAIPYVLISYLFYTWQRMYVNPNLPILPTLFAPFLIFQPRRSFAWGLVAVNMWFKILRGYNTPRRLL